MVSHPLQGDWQLPHRSHLVMAVTVLEEPKVATVIDGATIQSLETSLEAAGSSMPELLTSTVEHRMWTYGCMALLATQLGASMLQAGTPGDEGTLALALLAAYVLSDLGTGIYHWGVDNYGGPDTPFFGRQIAAFQGHHQRPWTITQREFCNNLHQVFKPATYPAAALLAMSPMMPGWWNTWSSSFLFLVCMSQQFHAWSHMKKSQLHPAVILMQDVGLLISRKAHGAHHRAPFEGNYCIVSGLWNPLLDGSGFFRWLEQLVHEQTGTEPRCWHEPRED